VTRRERGFYQRSVPRDCSVCIERELVFDNLIRQQRTRDVRAACCLARADVWVQLPLGAFDDGLRNGCRWRINAVGPVLVRAGGR
jgi:hypothetical protein